MIKYLNDIKRTGEILINLSNVFFVIAALIVLNKNPAIGCLFLLIAIVSVIHHAEYNILLNKKIWGKIDIIVACTGSITIFIYGLKCIYNNKDSHIINTHRTFLLVMCSVILAVFASGICISGACCDYNSKKCPKSLETECEHINYLIYHSLWHILIGVSAMMFVILITFD